LIKKRLMYPKNNSANTPENAGVNPSPRFPDVEREILDFWEKDGTFQASIDQRSKSNEFVFYDGPPFANGLPHYGHLLTGYAKSTCRDPAPAELICGCCH